jgi:dihydroorotate dehydrogenase
LIFNIKYGFSSEEVGSSILNIQNKPRKILRFSDDLAFLYQNNQIVVYKLLLKPLLFQLQAEKAHHFTFSLIKSLHRIPGFGILFSALYDYQHPNLATKVFGLEFKNPVGLAAGFDKDAKLIDELSNVGFGFIEIGTLTPLAQEGNPQPRLFRLPKDQALINRMGFNNQGLATAAERLKKRKSKVLVGGNIGKNKVTPNEEAYSDYEKCFEALYELVDYFVVNVSSPNTPNLRELQDKEPLSKLLSHVQQLNQQKPKQKPVLLKIAPDLNHSQLDDIIAIVKETGIAGVIATNTTISREGLQESSKKVDQIGAGGLSGKPLKDKSTEVIAYLHRQSAGTFPIIGVGGIHSPQDAMEKLKAGASLVQVYTGFVYEGPGLVKRINKALIQSNYPQLH